MKVVASLLVYALAGGLVQSDVDSRKAREAEIERFPRCPERRGDVSRNWPTQNGPYGEFSFQSPESCVEEELGENEFFLHGGARWRCGELSVTLAYGHWGASSFPSDGDWCVATIDRRETLIITNSEPSGADVVAWYIFNGASHNPLLHVTSVSAKKKDIVLDVIYSATRTPRRREP